MRGSVFGGILLALFLVPTALQGQSDLLGDKDCFGTGGPCVEDGVTWLPGGAPSVTQGPGDPVWQDIVQNTSSTTSWSHFVTPGSYSSASLIFRTAGIADVTGPYDVFVDGVSVGQMPWDQASHFLVETFTFILDPLSHADGQIDVSFTSQSADGWAIDYSELVYSASVPEPGSMLLMATGLFGLVGVRARRRS